MSNVFHHLIEIELFLLKYRFFTVEHTHLQHFLYQEAKSFRLIIYHTTQMFLHLLTLGNRGIIEHLSSQADTGYRRLQLMGHIVDEIILDFRIPLLPEDNHNGKDEGDQQYQSKDYTWYHEAHT